MKKGAVELSANFIVVLVISIVLLVGGLVIFFKMKDNAKSFVDTLDTQTEDKIKSFMLANNHRVAIYPNQITLSPGESKLVGLGITNELTGTKNFQFSLKSVKHFTSPETAGPGSISNIDIQPTHLQSLNVLGPTPQIAIPAKEFSSKGILIGLKSGAPKGQYILSFRVIDTSTPAEDYGVASVFVTYK